MCSRAVESHEQMIHMAMRIAPAQKAECERALVKGTEDAAISLCDGRRRVTDWVERRQTLRLPPRQCDRSDTDTVGEHVVEMILCVGLARGRVETGGHRATVYQGEQLAEYGATENGERDRPQVQLVLCVRRE
eukprot:5894491-Prymnesium_polylepis.3